MSSVTNLVDLQSLEWSPAACFVGFQGSLVLRTAVSLLLGQTDGLYKFEPYTKEISSPPYELALGSLLLGWGLGMVGALIVGGATVMCILQLIPMLAATYYHYVCGGKSGVAANAVFMVGAACCGLLSSQEVQPIEWTPAAILMTIYGGLIAVTGLAFLFGKADSIYENEPHTKAMMSRRGELQVGSCLLGWGIALWAGTIAGGAQNMCILYLPGLLAATYSHYSQGGMKNVMVNVAFMIPAAYLGFAR